MEIKVGIVNHDEKKQLWQISQQTMTIEVDPHPYRPDEYDRFLQKIQQGKAIMMIENLNVLGALIYYPVTTPEYTFWEFELFVRPEEQGKGIAKKLLKQLLCCAEEQHIAFIQLHVLGTNPRAIRLYEYMGFKRMEEKNGTLFLANQWVDDFTYQLRLLRGKREADS